MKPVPSADEKDVAPGLAWLLGRVNYERLGLPDSRTLRLDRTRQLAGAMGDPQNRLRIVHVGGTNGKGSTASAIAEILRETGSRVGLHTSPHLVRLNERFVVDGQAIADDALSALLDATRRQVEELERRTPGQPPLTFFEITAAMVFEHFARSRCDFAVVEVGMGGRLDATNIVDPEVSVVTNVGLDHQRSLGLTVTAIAREKAGIVKPGRPVVSAATQPEVVAVLRAAADRARADLRLLGTDFRLRPDGDRFVFEDGSGAVAKLALRHRSDEQVANQACALMAALTVCGEGTSLPSAKRLSAALDRYALPGRGELMGEGVPVILDGAHNGPAVAALSRRIRAEHAGRRPKILVFGCSADKDWATLLDALLPWCDRIVCTAVADNRRALDPQAAARHLADRGFRDVSAMDDPRQALHQARHDAGASGLVVVAGSLYLVGAVRGECGP